MKVKPFVVLQSVFLGLGLLALTPAVNPTSTGKPSNPSELVATQPATSPAPKLNPNPNDQRKPLAVWECKTSWYGEDFDGQPTANGETYDMYAVTAAHPTLVNTRNHRFQVVLINDRGPYVVGRELDVSYEVARRLGFDQSGLAKVRLELLEVPSRPATERRD
jgi:hypothetical protein